MNQAWIWIQLGSFPLPTRTATSTRGIVIPLTEQASLGIEHSVRPTKVRVSFRFLGPLGTRLELHSGHSKKDYVCSSALRLFSGNSKASLLEMFIDV
jgi:hypothetical protein